jgi:L-iditol 2-dehydrogenase
MLAGGLHRVPDNVSFVEASVAEPLACAINAQDLARVGETEGETVVVFGPGPIGALHVRLARARGAAKVVLIGRRRPRLDMTVERVHPDLAVVSEETDPVEAVLELTGGRGADVVITAAGSGQAQEQAVEMAARRGRISLFGGLPRDNPTITLDSNKVHYRELTIVGASASLPEQHGRALEMIGSGAIPVADLVTHRLPLERAIEGIETVISGDGIKVTIEP